MQVQQMKKNNLPQMNKHKHGFNMKKIFLILTIFGLNILFAQQMEDALSEILKNNQELKAISEMNKLEVLNAKNELIPDNPELEQEFRENNNYEIGITQSFQFPTFYYHQYKNVQLTKKQQEAIYRATKVRILEEAKIGIFKLSYLENQTKIQEERLENATQLASYFIKMLNEGEITQLELNQAKIHKIAFDNQLQNLHIEKAEVVESLKLLNGGNDVNLSIIEYSKNQLNIKNLKDEYLEKNPDLAIEQINQQIADRHTKIAKYGWLPDFKLGVHKEKESDPMLHYGISIPLWKNRNHVNRAKANQRYNATNLQYTKQSVVSKFDQLGLQFSILQNKLNLNLSLDLNTKELLEKSLKAGEISSIEYFTELENLYEFEDELLKTKLDLEVVKVKLTSFKF